MLTFKHKCDIIDKNIREVREMFENIGGKIKATATVVCCIGIIASVLLGFGVMSIADDFVLLGFLITTVGSLISWVSSFSLYGFGQLVENSDKLCADIKTKENTKETSSENNQVQNV